MKITRSIPRNRRLPSLRNVLMIDTVRGVLRVRKWPKKYGKPRSASQAYWVDWFKQANLLAKYADPMSQRRAIEMTKGSGLYPRDVLLKAMRGRLYWWIDDTGWKWYPMAGISDISGALDVLGQTVADVLVRATDRWRPARDGATGLVLTHQGPGAPPKWAAPAVPILQEQLAGSPITPDNSVSEYVFDVSDYARAQFIFDDVDLASSDTIKFRLSTDDGSSYHAGATENLSMYLSSAAEASGAQAQFDLSDGAGATGHYACIELASIQAPRLSWRGMVGRTLTSTASRAGFARFDGPVTHVKFFTGGGAKFSGGTIHAMGMHS